jgi:wyosine [tRNA(Phe)-imidazoG37] synthetase (radical SAM superfamily)
VYPVMSRRAEGISIGVNLNRDRFCNFNCVYCQVDRSGPGDIETLDLSLLARELDAVLEQYLSGELFQDEPFCRAAPEQRRLNDIALSGDGEPTAQPLFGEAVALTAEARRKRRLDELKLVLITNASLLDREPVRRAVEVLDRNHGEIWAKLDAGTEAYFRQVARSSVPYSRILANLGEAARIRPIVLQTLFMRLHDAGPPPEEISAYCGRLREILAGGGAIRAVQIYTVARAAAECWVAPLADAELDRIAAVVREATGAMVMAYYGYSAEKD